MTLSFAAYGANSDRVRAARVRLKTNIKMLSEMLHNLDGHRFWFYVVSAAPQEVIQSALEGIVPEDHIFGTRFRYHPETGEIQSIARVPAGYGKVAVVDELRAAMGVGHDRVVYVGDGSSDVHVMLHVNRLDGMTIAVSENKYITQIARRTILSDDALSVIVPCWRKSSVGTPRACGRSLKLTVSCCANGTRCAPIPSPSAAPRVQRRREG